MRGALRFLLSLVVAGVAILAFRGLVVTLYTIDGDALYPTLQRGDRVLVNRWSYGLRTGSVGSAFDYARLWKQEMERGDIVAFESPLDSLKGVFIGRCTALPGDSLKDEHGLLFIVPGVITCEAQDSYWIECIGRQRTADSRTFGPIADSLIIGKVVAIVYNHNDSLPPYKGFNKNRFLVMP